MRLKPLNQKGSLKIFYVTTVAWVIAQGMKVLIYWYRYHKINFRLFVLPRFVFNAEIGNLDFAFYDLQAMRIGDLLPSSFVFLRREVLKF